MEDVIEEPPKYSAVSCDAQVLREPTIVKGIRSFLSLPRNFNTDDFSKLVSSDSTDRKDYYYGLIFVSVVVLSIFLVWGSVLVMLKCMGSSVGCASGNSVDSLKNKNGLFSDETGSVESDLSGSNEFDDMDDEETQSVKRRRHRERRMRIAFLLAVIVTITCCVLSLVWAFSPIRESLNGSDDTVIESQEIIEEIHNVLGSVSNAVELVNSTLSSASFDFHYYCPDADPGLVELANLEALGELIKEEFHEIETASENITDINRTIDQIQEILDIVQDNLHTTTDYLWVVPGLLAAVSVTTAVAFSGLVMAWKGKSGICVQRGMSYGVLPLLIVFSVACWVITIGAGISAMVSGDACVDGDGPDETVLDIMEQYGVNSNETLYSFVTSYTNGCIGEDPTTEISDIEEEIEDKSNLIWRHISVIDSIGREQIAQTCGKDMDELMDRGRFIANSLLVIRKGLSNLASSVKCSRISSIYVETVHDSLCTDAASGSSWGFLLFFILSMSMMVIITLRASWYHQVKEENVYEEEEVAENMVLDEHEEYLNYISKYKHEWQEYNGINATSIDVPNENDEGSEGEGSEDYDSDLDSREKSLEENSLPEQAPTPVSINTDDISFPSLRVPAGDASQQGETTNSWMEYDVTTSSLPPLLPPMMVAVPSSGRCPDDESVDTVQKSLPDFVEDEQTPAIEVHLESESTADTIPTAVPLFHVDKRSQSKSAPEEDTNEAVSETRTNDQPQTETENLTKTSDSENASSSSYVTASEDVSEPVVVPNQPKLDLFENVDHDAFSNLESTQASAATASPNTAQGLALATVNDKTDKGNNQDFANFDDMNEPGVKILPTTSSENVEMALNSPPPPLLGEEPKERTPESLSRLETAPSLDVFFSREENNKAEDSFGMPPPPPPQHGQEEERQDKSSVDASQNIELFPRDPFESLEQNKDTTGSTTDQDTAAESHHTPRSYRTRRDDEQAWTPNQGLSVSSDNKDTQNRDYRTSFLDDGEVAVTTTPSYNYYDPGHFGRPFSEPPKDNKKKSNDSTDEEEEEEPPRRDYRTLSFALGQDTPPPPPPPPNESTSVAQKVDLFAKHFSEPNKPPTPGRRPKLKSTQTAFLDES